MLNNSPLRAPHNRARSLLAGTIGLTMMLAGSLTLVSPASAATATLLSALKPVTVSSVEPPHEARQLTDGDPATRWASATGEGAWAEVALQQACTITQVDLNWEFAFAKEYVVEGRVDGKLEVLKMVTGGEGGQESLNELAAIGKVSAVRVTSVLRALPHGISLHDLSVFGGDCEDLPEEPTVDPETPVDPQLGTVISGGASAIASSVENGTMAPGLVTDGDPTTRWSSNATDNEWIMLDLGARFSVSAVAFDWENSYAKNYRVETSPNGWDWSEFATVTNSPGNTEVLRVTEDVTDVRFVRMTSSLRSSNFGVSMWEFRVYGDNRVELPTQYDEGKTSGTSLLSYRKSATASSSQNDAQCVECTTDKMFDQDMGTRWAVAEKDWSDNAWITLDLGKSALISQIALRWDPAFATAYRYDVAPTADGPWTQVYGTIAGKGNKDVVNIEPTEGQFLKLTMQERANVWGNKYGYSIYEFRVFGTGGDPVEPPEGPANPDFDNLKLVWNDEFDAPKGAPAHSSKWTIDNTAKPGDNNNAELQLYTANTNNVRHDGEGNLIVEAKVDDLHGAKVYTSGRLNTSQKVQAQYGRFEARVKVPEGKGLWPAFWMMGASFLEGRPWPSNGEIDIMEVLGHDTTVSHSTIHGPGYSGMGGRGGSYSLPSKEKLSEDFHVWSAEWDSTGIRFALDGIQTFEITKDYVENTLNQAWVYDQEFYIILNLAVGGDWPGSPDALTEFPAQMLVDYVRVFQSEGSGSITHGATPGSPVVEPVASATLGSGTADTLGVSTSGDHQGAGSADGSDPDASTDAAHATASGAAANGSADATLASAPESLSVTGLSDTHAWVRWLSLALVLGGAAVLLQVRLSQRRETLS